jgi:hypothetical protein
VARKRWNELDPRVREALLVAAAFEAGLKVASLIDLAQRPADEVRGSKAVWAATLLVANSGGIVPIVYLLRGRRREPKA